MKDTKKLIVEFIDIGTAFLVIFIISNILNVIAIGPFISMTNVESKRVAELMSLLPDNMDVESLIVQAGGLQDDDSDDEQSGQRKTDDKVKKKRKKRGLFKRLYQAWKDDGEEQPQGKKGSDGEVSLGVKWTISTDVVYNLNDTPKEEENTGRETRCLHYTYDIRSLFVSVVLTRFLSLAGRGVRRRT